jgi:hypothetical protein
MSWRLIRFIFSYIPKWIKSWIGGIITIVLGLGGSLLQAFLEGKELVLPNITTFGLYLIFALGVIAILGIVIANYKILKKYIVILNTSPSVISITQPQTVAQGFERHKKHLSDNFELQHIAANDIEFIVFIRRCWFPNEAIPGIEEFISALFISKQPICAKCKSDLLVYRTSQNWPTLKCLKCQISVDPFLIEEITEVSLASFKGEIRKNYKLFWKKYCDKYDECTNGKYEDYEYPIK